MEQQLQNQSHLNSKNQEGRLWYYVKNNSRVGPLKESQLMHLFEKKEIDLKVYFWTQGEANWKMGVEFSELQQSVEKLNINKKSEENQPKLSSLIWAQISYQTQIIFLKAKDSNLFGPFSLAMLENLQKQKRVSATDQCIVPGMDTWEVLYNAFPKSFQKPNNLTFTQSNYDCYEEVPISARVKFLGESFWCILRDFSLSGTQILTSQLKANRGDKLVVEVITSHSSHSLIPIQAKVARVLNENLGYFLLFDKISPKSSEILNQINQF